MVYKVGFGKRNKPGVSTVRTNTAQEAIELAEALTRSDEEIQFIDTPTDGRVGIDMLRVLAKEEAAPSIWAVSREVSKPVISGVSRSQTRHSHRVGSNWVTVTSSRRG
jgi:hypothetical protein